MEEAQITGNATVGEVEPVSFSATPEELINQEREKALADFKAVIATKPGKAAIKAFLNTKATHFLTQTFAGSMTRKQRRDAARQVAKRMTKRVIAGEEVF